MKFEEWSGKMGFDGTARVTNIYDSGEIYADWKAEREKFIGALVKAAIPLEAINMSVKWELADSIKWDIQEAIDCIRAALAEVKEKP